jgi:hypothetical protein
MCANKASQLPLKILPGFNKIHRANESISVRFRAAVFQNRTCDETPAIEVHEFAIRYVLAGTLLFRSGRLVGLRKFEARMQHRVFLFMCFLLITVSSVQAATPGQLIFPVFAWSSTQGGCRTWSSFLSAFNPHSTTTTLTLEAFDAKGKSLATRSMSVSPYTTSLSANFLVTGMAWAKVTTSDSVLMNEMLEAGSICPSDGFQVDVRTRIDAPAAPQAKDQFVSISFDKDSGINTGLSIVYPSTPGSASANGKLIHRGTDGAVVAEHDVVLVPNGQLVGMISDILTESVSATGGKVQGSLEISFDQNVSATAFTFGWQQTLEEPAILPLAGVAP